jgi:hypothetical protein
MIGGQFGLLTVWLVRLFLSPLFKALDCFSFYGEFNMRVCAMNDIRTS